MLKKIKGFTLLEILIAIFVFAIIAVIISTTLRSIFSAQTRLEQRSEKIQQLQMALFYFSRDITQLIDRPVTLATGMKEAALVGTRTSLGFTHGGVINPGAIENRSTLERTYYKFEQQAFVRETWPVLDQTEKLMSSQKIIMTPITDLYFQYLDDRNQLQDRWPPLDNPNKKFPRAIRVTMVTPNWGQFTQWYPL